MLRAVTLGVALSVLVAACALVEPPVPPPGTRNVEARVRNASAVPVELKVVTATGRVLADAVWPPSLPAGSETDVTFYVPDAGQWWIRVPDGGHIGERAVAIYAGRRCAFLMEFTADQGVDFGVGCLPPR